MHGVIFAELQKYVTARLGPDAWATLVQQSGVSTKVFLPVQEYPDADALALVTTASQVTGKPAGAILEDLGEFIVPDLVKIYGALIKPEWKTLDLLETHRGHHPPGGAHAQSRRAVRPAKGIVKGVAKAYGERVVISEAAGMNTGDPACVISVKTP